MTSSHPTEAKAWQYSKTVGGIETHMQLNTVPIPTPKPNQHLIRVIAVSLNPVDYKIAEAASFAIKMPATPAADLAGEIVTPASGSSLKEGQLVFGQKGVGPAAGGALAEYVVANNDQIVAVPEGVSPADAASLPIVGITAYQSLEPYVKPGNHVFLNGGSGGTGICGIQIAKILGAHVTVTCSSKNVELCKSFGADEVIDYSKGDVLAQLKALPYKFDHIVDNVGGNYELYYQCDQYTNPGATWAHVGGSPKLSEVVFAARAKLVPSFLGGQKRKFIFVVAKIDAKGLKQLIDWVAEGKLKVNIDSRFPFDQAPEAYKKLKTGRTVGKIIVDVGPSAPSPTAAA